MKIRIVGAYLPRLSQEALRLAAEQEAERFRKAILALIEDGISTASVSQVAERTPEYAEEIAHGLQGAALFEAEVTENTEEFDGRCFYSPEIDSYGWSPTFLIEDGSQVLTADREETTYESRFRVLFFLNDWSDDCTLDGPNGPLQFPPLTPVPPRAWKLAVYETLD
jgi:hypothetical protein